jgi:hypothetical protein
MKSPGNFFDELQGRSGGADDSLDVCARHQKFRGKFVGLAFDLFRFLAPISDIRFCADEFRLVVARKEEMADFVSESEIFAAGLTVRLSDHNRSKRKLPSANQGSIKPVRIHFADFQAESWSQPKEIGGFAGQLAGKRTGIRRAFG